MADRTNALAPAPLNALANIYQRYVGQPFAAIAGGGGRGFLGLEPPQYGGDLARETYRVGQAMGNMPGVGAPAGAFKVAAAGMQALPSVVGDLGRIASTVPLDINKTIALRNAAPQAAQSVIQQPVFHRTTVDFKGEFKNVPNKKNVSFAGNRGFYFSKDANDPTTQIFGKKVIPAQVNITNPAPVDQIKSTFFSGDVAPRIVVPVDYKWVKENKNVLQDLGLVRAKSKEDVIAGLHEQRASTFTEEQNLILNAAKKNQLFTLIDPERLTDLSVKLLELKGYDGIDYTKPLNTKHPMPSQVVAFRPEQIKRLDE